MHKAEIIATGRREKAASLDELGTRTESFDESRNLLRRHRSVGIEHDNGITAANGEARPQCVALAPLRLIHHHDVRSRLESDLGGPVDGVAVHDDDLPDRLR